MIDKIVEVANDRWGILYCPKGRGSKQREKIQRVLDERKVQYDFVQSESTESVERLMTMLIRNGYKTIIIMGGDSALNDAVNCLMAEEKQVRDSIALGVIPNGVMNDFARYWGFTEGEMEQTVDWLLKRRVRTVDLGCVRYTNKKNEHCHRYFLWTDSRHHEPAPPDAFAAGFPYAVVRRFFLLDDIPSHGLQNACALE